MLTSLRPPSGGELLDLWEWGQAQAPALRALALLSAASPQVSTETFADLSIGRRDGLLFALRQLLFGPRIGAVTVCPQCGEQVEMTFEVKDICPRMEEESPSIAPLEIAGWRIDFRLPNSYDLLALEDSVTPDEARGRLLERCLLEVRQDGGLVNAASLPDTLSNMLAERMLEADPQARIQLDLHCPSCGHAWSPVFDILSFLWDEIHSWGLHVLQDVHMLASAYGWSETEILALSPWRRQAYLEMVRG